MLLRDALARTLGAALTPFDEADVPDKPDETLDAGDAEIEAAPIPAGSGNAVAQAMGAVPKAEDGGPTADEVPDDPRTAVAGALRSALIEVASRPGENLTTYSELARRLGLDLADDAQRHAIGVLLGSVSRTEVAAGRPMLSSIVVQYEGGTPGAGFFTLGRELDVVRDGEDADLFAFRQMRATWNYWQAVGPNG